jgi:hypothetical protein
MKTISLKKTWISTDAWRGYYRPLNAVCGANDTGGWSDSPCPSDVRANELGMAKKTLRHNRINFKQTWSRSSNVFCVHVYLCVAPEDKQRAVEVLKPLEQETRLLYLCE